MFAPETPMDTLYPPLTDDFYLQDTVQVAQNLLNCLLIRHTAEGWMVGRISETEAYTQNDPASHTYRGKTERNASMFRVGGTAYVYFTYGMHHCLNTVTGPEGFGSGVLLRAVEPILGFEQLQRNRRTKESLDEKSVADLPRFSRERIKLGIALCGGPGKLCQAFALNREQNGLNLRRARDIWVAAAMPEWEVTPREVVATPRIGITQAADTLWRFTLKTDPYLSKK